MTNHRWLENYSKLKTGRLYWLLCFLRNLKRAILLRFGVWFTFSDAKKLCSITSWTQDKNRQLCHPLLRPERQSYSSEINNIKRPVQRLEWNYVPRLCFCGYLFDNSNELIKHETKGEAKIHMNELKRNCLLQLSILSRPLSDETSRPHSTAAILNHSWMQFRSVSF